jgi:ABC-type branched-subunit amino acid transport system substrate-binding protein
MPIATFRPLIFCFHLIEWISKLTAMINRSLSFLIALLLISSAASFGGKSKSTTAPDQMFSRSQRLVREKNYSEAIDILKALAESNQNSPEADKYSYALGRAFYLAGNFGKATEVLTAFTVKFRQSRYLSHGYHLLGNCEYRLGRPGEAFSSYLTAYRRAADDQLKQLSERSLQAVVENGFIPSDTLVAALPPEISCSVKIRMAGLLKGQWKRSKIEKLVAGCPGAKFAEDQQRGISGPVMSVGVLLPLSGPYAKYGQAILDGAMVASGAARKRGVPLDLKVYDSKADHTTAARAALAMVDEGIDVAFGPLLSDVAATTAATLACRHIPLLVPAASQAAFTEISPTCFQMTPNTATVGRGLAQYAVGHKKMKLLAVFVPATLDEIMVAESFADEAVRLGAPRPIIEKFRPEETDFTAYIKDLKRAISGKPDDSAIYIAANGDTLPPGDEPVTLDAIFIPANTDQLNLLLPQLDFHKVECDYLGGEEWDNDIIRRLDQKVLRRSVFYSSAAAAFGVKFSGKPDRLTALGYDAINLFVAAWKSGRRGPTEIAEYLGTVTGYNGASGRITFGRNRSNRELPLFTIERGAVTPLTEAIPVEEKPGEELPADTTDIEEIKN